MNLRPTTRTFNLFTSERIFAVRIETQFCDSFAGWAVDVRSVSYKTLEDGLVPFVSVEVIFFLHIILYFFLKHRCGQISISIQMIIKVK